MKTNRFTAFVRMAGKLARTLATPPALLIIGIVFGLMGVPIHAAGFAAGTQQTDSEFIRQLAAWGVLDAAGGPKKRMVAKTADYTVLSPATSAGDASGTIFTNRGATGAVIFTLPAPTLALTGVYFEFLGIANQNITVQTATADTLVVVNDTAADSLAISTANQKIGSVIRAVCDGTAWVAYGCAIGAGGDTGTNAYTVAT